MSPRRYLCLLPLFLAVLTAGSALASIGGGPVKIRFVGEPPAVRPFEPYTANFELVAAVDLAVERFEFGGVGVSKPQAEKSLPPDLAADRPAAMTVSLVPTEAEPVLTVRYRYEDHVYEMPVDLAAARREWQDGTRADLLPDGVGDKAGLRFPKRRFPVAVAAGDPADDGPEDDGPGDGAGQADKAAPAARTITITGSIKYRRQDGVWVHPEGVPVDAWDEDVTYDDHLASGVTGAGGSFSLTFSWDPCWLCEDNPDIYVEFELLDARIDVQTDVLERTYSFTSPVSDDFKGTSISHEGLTAHDNKYLLNIFVNLRRAFNRFLIAGYDMDTIDVQYPGISTYYDPYFEEIHLESERRWLEESYFHEMGHHWSNHYADFFNPLAAYCNGTCDIFTAAPLCTHCKWCAENFGVGELEGIAHYISWLTCTVVGNTYQPAPANYPYLEEIQPCWDTVDNESCSCDPEHTEGFIAAFLIDLADDANEDDPAASGFADVLSFNGWDILAIEDDHQPSSVSSWWNQLKAHYPDQVPQLWETARNSTFDFDTQVPADVTGLRSNDHSINVASPDATLHVAWDAAADDASGVVGYSWSVTSAPANPGTTVDTPFTSHVTTPLLPGTWYFNIRAVDRKGNASRFHSTFGPVIIREPYLSDLHLETSATWPLSVVATSETHTGTGGPPVSPMLVGWDATYWHFQGRNDGESTIPETMANRVRVDGTPLGVLNLASGSPNMLFAFKNRGPIVVPGGRHAVTVALDADEVVPETNESNNVSGGQWVWSPIPLTVNGPRYFPAPRRRNAGWEGVSGAYYNADGYRFTSSGWWNAVYAFTDADTSDYDLRLHQPSTGSTNGYSVNQGWSGRPPGLLDALLVNRNTAGSQDWDVGVLNAVDGGCAFTIRHVVSAGVNMGSSRTVTLGPDELMAVVEFQVSSTIDPPSLVVETAPGGPTLHMAWFDANFVTGDLLDGRAYASTGGDGVARLDIDVERTGYHALVVWREPASRAVSTTFTARVFLTPPDLVPFAASDWYAPLVPRSYYANTPYVVSAPDTLHGNTFLPPAGTYLSACASNRGPMDASAVPSRFQLDGVDLLTYEWYALLSGIPEKRFFNTAYRVRGGRHTLSFLLDDPDGTAEISETNNVYGAQWVWGPQLMSYTDNGYRSMPPDPLGGWATITTPVAEIGYNCDGLRIPAPDGGQQPGRWQAVAAMPGDTSNVDIILYEAEAGTQDGFRDYLAASTWGPGQIDYLLIDNNLTARRAFDVGVIRRQGGQGYHHRAVNSVNLGQAPAERFGPYTMGQVQYLHLYEFEIRTAGEYGITLRNVSGEVNWGMAVHKSGRLTGEEPVQARVHSVEYGQAWLNGPGEGEAVSFTVPDRYLRYCLVVYKADGGDVQGTGTYELMFGPGLSDTPDATAPTRPAIVSVYPNPFNPQTMVAFDVTAGGETSVEVYDVRGRLVRTLVVPTPAAGRYEVEWNGLDHTGRAAASGSYFLRLRTGGAVQDLAKVVLVR